MRRETSLILIGFTLSALAGVPVAADEVRVRDRFGNTLGTVEPAPGGTASSGSAIVRDRFGNRLGTIEPTPSGDAEIRDRFGNRTGTLEGGGTGRPSALETLLPPRAGR